MALGLIGPRRVGAERWLAFGVVALLGVFARVVVVVVAGPVAGGGLVFAVVLVGGAARLWAGPVVVGGVAGVRLWGVWLVELVGSVWLAVWKWRKFGPFFFGRR